MKHGGKSGGGHSVPRGGKGGKGFTPPRPGGNKPSMVEGHKSGLGRGNLLPKSGEQQGGQ
jgi:hypothetical protein